MSANEPEGSDPAAQASGDRAEGLALAHRVAVLAETDPAAPLIVATRAALDIADARRSDRQARRLAGQQIHGGDSEWWPLGRSVDLCRRACLPPDRLPLRRRGRSRRAGPDAAMNDGGIAYRAEH